MGRKAKGRWPVKTRNKSRPKRRVRGPVSSPSRVDPSRTATLRRTMIRESNARVNRLALDAGDRVQELLSRPFQGMDSLVREFATWFDLRVDSLFFQDDDWWLEPLEAAWAKGATSAWRSGKGRTGGKTGEDYALQSFLGGLGRSTFTGNSSGCGAGAEGRPGFLPGNTCGAGGGSPGKGLTQIGGEAFDQLRKVLRGTLAKVGAGRMSPEEGSARADKARTVADARLSQAFVGEYRKIRDVVTRKGGSATKLESIRRAFETGKEEAHYRTASMAGTVRALLASGVKPSKTHLKQLDSDRTEALKSLSRTMDQAFSSFMANNSLQARDRLGRFASGTGSALGGLARMAGRIPGRVLGALKSKAKALYGKLERRYGKGVARAAIAAFVVGNAIPAPGASLMAMAPIVASAELWRQFRRAPVGNSSFPDIERIAEAYGRALFASYARMSLTESELDALLTPADQDLLTNAQLRDVRGRFMSEKVGLMAARLENELKGATAAISQGVARELVQAIENKLTPSQAARAITRKVKEIGLKRARVIANTELVRAQAEGQLDGMEALGVERVTPAVEWATASTPCGMCAPLRGIVVTITEARGMIPRHPNCRCSWKDAATPRAPESPRRKLAKSSIEKAIVRSLREEGEVDYDDESGWGAGETISKRRPELNQLFVTREMVLFNRLLRNR